MPRFLHVKPKARPDEIVSFQNSIKFFLFRVKISLILFLVFSSEYYSNIAMRLRAIPNSTEVWWQMSENRTGYKINPSCKLYLFKSRFILFIIFVRFLNPSPELFEYDFFQ